MQVHAAPPESTVDQILGGGVWLFFNEVGAFGSSVQTKCMSGLSNVISNVALYQDFILTQHSELQHTIGKFIVYWIKWAKQNEYSECIT